MAIDKIKIESLHRSVDIVLECLDEMCDYPQKNELASERSLDAIEQLRDSLSLFHEVVRKVERRG